MEVEAGDLKEIYQAYVRSNERNSRKGCPSTNALVKLARGSRLFARRSNRIIDHVFNCCDCAREFQFILEVLRRENALIKELESLIESNNKSRIRRPWFYSLRQSWRTIAALAGAAIICVVFILSFAFRRTETYRSADMVKPELVEPVGSRVSISRLLFRWKGVNYAEYYVFELLDEALQPIWKSEEIMSNELVLPEEILRKLEVDGLYFWMVTARLPAGEKRISSIRDFSLQK